MQSMDGWMGFKVGGRPRLFSPVFRVFGGLKKKERSIGYDGGVFGEKSGRVDSCSVEGRNGKGRKERLVGWLESGEGCQSPREGGWGGEKVEQ